MKPIGFVAETVGFHRFFINGSCYIMIKETNYIILLYRENGGKSYENIKTCACGGV